MMNKIITICIFSTLFFSSYILFRTPFEFYLPYLFIIILLPLFITKYTFPYRTLFLLIPLLFSGLISIWSGDNTYPFFFKIFINIIISILFYYYVFEAYEFDLNKLFGYYMKGAYIVALIGFIQFISFQIGFKYGYDFSWLGLNKWGIIKGGITGIRINSIMSEPAYFGGYIGAAAFISIYNVLYKKTQYISRLQSFIIIFIYLLSSSSVAYTGIFIILILFLLNFGLIRYVVIFAPIVIGGYYYLYNNVEDFRKRVDGTTELYSGEATSAFEVHGSSFVQFNNTHVATENFKRNPLFGTGLGSHQVAYAKYSLAKQFGNIYDFNSADANSMFLRIVSETGLFGIIFIFLFLIKYFILKDNDHSPNEYWLISNAVLVVIILQLLRMGNYTYNGFFFYMWMYYFAKKKLIESQEPKSEMMISNEEVPVS